MRANYLIMTNIPQNDLNIARYLLDDDRKNVEFLCKQEDANFSGNQLVECTRNGKSDA